MASENEIILQYLENLHGLSHLNPEVRNALLKKAKAENRRINREDARKRKAPLAIIELDKCEIPDLDELHPRSFWFKRSFHRAHRQETREFLAEFLAMSMLVVMGYMIASWVIIRDMNYPSTFQAIGWGFSYAASCYICGGYSGGALNPALSLAMFTCNNIGQVYPQVLKRKWSNRSVSNAFSFSFHNK